MSDYLKKNVQLQILALFIILPLLIWAAGPLPTRSMLKETLSVLIILAFSLVIGLFYLSRANIAVTRQVTFRKILNVHKCVGYLAVSVLLLHPFLLVVPRFFEAGVDPIEAFGTIVTTLTSTGVLLGILAWCLLLVIAVTALCRQWLPLQYRTWRVLHALLASASIVCAAWHVVDLGRHADVAMSLFIGLLSAGGLLLLTRYYLAPHLLEGKKS